MGYYWLTFNCAGCGNVAMANPDKVLCLVIDGNKEPICKSCADRWNQIHRIDKGLPPVDYGDAYEKAACDGLPDVDCFYPDSEPWEFYEY